jgi:hypothetical protein
MVHVWACSKTTTAESNPALYASLEMPRILSVSRPISDNEM